MSSKIFFYSILAGVKGVLGVATFAKVIGDDESFLYKILRPKKVERIEKNHEVEDKGEVFETGEVPSVISENDTIESVEKDTQLNKGEEKPKKEAAAALPQIEQKPQQPPKVEPIKPTGRYVKMCGVKGNYCAMVGRDY